MTTQKDKLPKTEQLICHCCGQYCRGRQWHERDKRYGTCNRCAKWLLDKDGPEYLKEVAGKYRYHYCVDASPKYIPELEDEPKKEKVMSVNGIEITDVIIFPVKREKEVENSALKAFARIILNDQFIISGVRIFKGKNGCFVQFPQEYTKHGKEGPKGYDICFPITAEFRSYINDEILSQYKVSVEISNEGGADEVQDRGNDDSETDAISSES